MNEANELPVKHFEKASFAGVSPAKLAAVAATLLKPGMENLDALEAAYELITQADQFLFNKTIRLVNDDALYGPKFACNIIRMGELLKCRSGKTMKKRLFAILPPEEAEKIWKRALVGENVFTWAIQQRLVEVNKTAINEAQAKRRAGRKATSG